MTQRQLEEPYETCPRCGDPQCYLSDWSGENVCRDCGIELAIDRLRCEECDRPIGRTDDKSGMVDLLGWKHKPGCSMAPQPETK